MDHSGVFGYDWDIPFVYPTSAIQVTLQAGQQAVLNETQTSGDLSGFGTFAANSSYPLQYYDEQGNATAQSSYTVASAATVALVMAGGTMKEVDTVTVTATQGGSQVFSQSAVIDPIVRQGCGCGCGTGAGCSCGSGSAGSPPEPLWKKVRRRASELGVAGACGIAWFGGAVSGVVGSLGSVAVGWIYEEVWE